MTAQTTSSSRSRYAMHGIANANSAFNRNRPGWLASVGFAALLFGASSALAQTAPTLGQVQSFAVLGGSGVTAAPPMATGSIAGDVGSAPTPTVTGILPTVVTAGFTVYTAANTVTANARLAAGTAFTSLAAEGCTVIVSADLSLLPQPLVPGVYCMGAGSLTGTITLSGPASAVWVFKTASTLTTAGASNIVMAGGANSCNVFWQVGTSATLGAGSTFRGNIFSGVSIGVGTTAHVVGRLIAGSGAVTMDGSNTVDGCAVAGVGGLAATTLAGPAPLPDVTLGAAISDTKVLSGGGIGVLAPTGTITFTLFGPNDATCSTVIWTSPAVAVNGTGTYSSPSFTPSAAGIYRWIATYSGDANNAPTATACNAPNESVTVAATGAASGIPTLSEWAMILLAGLLAIAGFAAIRRQAR